MSLVEGLDLDDAALGLEFPEEGGAVVAVFLQLPGGEEAAVRDARAVVAGWMTAVIFGLRDSPTALRRFARAG